MQPLDNPNIQPVNPRPERGVPSIAPEQARSPETLPVAAVEQAGGRPSAPVQPPAATPSAVAPQTPRVAPPQQASVSTNAQLTTAGGDKIEKEWVDRVDAIIEQHAQDPFVEEEAHEDLSATYLKKRFNLDIKRSQSKG